MEHYLSEPTYKISDVSEMVSIHPQTLRQYEREGLIRPFRTKSNIRLYSLIDINDIKHILYLTRVCGVNVSGVKIILEKDRNIDILKNEIEEYKQKLEKVLRYGSNEIQKTLVVQNTSFEIVTFKN